MNNVCIVLFLMSLNVFVAAGNACCGGGGSASVAPFESACIDMPVEKPVPRPVGNWFGLGSLAVAPAPLSDGASSEAGPAASSDEDFVTALFAGAEVSDADSGVSCDESGSGGVSCAGSDSDDSCESLHMFGASELITPEILAEYPLAHHFSLITLNCLARRAKRKVECFCGFVPGLQVVPGGVLNVPLMLSEEEYRLQWIAARSMINILSERIVEFKDRMVDYPRIDFMGRPWFALYKKTCEQISDHHRAFRSAHSKCLGIAMRLLMGIPGDMQSVVSWFDLSSSGDSVSRIMGLRCWKCDKIWRFNELPGAGICNKKNDFSQAGEECGANLVLPAPEVYGLFCDELQKLTHMLEVALAQSRCALGLVDTLDAMDLSQ